MSVFLFVFGVQVNLHFLLCRFVLSSRSLCGPSPDLLPVKFVINVSVVKDTEVELVVDIVLMGMPRRVKI